MFKCFLRLPWRRLRRSPLKPYGIRSRRYDCNKNVCNLTSSVNKMRARWEDWDASGVWARRSLVTTMHGTNIAIGEGPSGSPSHALAYDIGLESALGGSLSLERQDVRSRTGAAGAEASEDTVISRIPYPTMDQVSCSVAIQRMQWLRHLPAPRTAAEQQIYRQIRALGWSAPR